MRPSCVRSRVLMIFTALVGACTTPAPTPVIEHEPIVFVHGNGDSAALWITTIWRFESNGWPRNRLFAFDVTYPLARDLDDVAQDGRTSTRENMLALAHEVDTVLDATGAKQVVLIGNSRGGFAIRDYILNGGGSTRVSAVILGGTPNHGVFFDPAHRLSGEFNGAGPFLTRLNEQGGPDSEITPGMRWLTVRSDHNDKYAQPDGLWIGAKGTPTQVTSEGPALKGAENVELTGRPRLVPWPSSKTTVS
jgi:triacylglycerol lipase